MCHPVWWREIGTFLNHKTAPALTVLKAYIFRRLGTILARVTVALDIATGDLVTDVLWVYFLLGKALPWFIQGSEGSAVLSMANVLLCHMAEASSGHTQPVELDADWIPYGANLVADLDFTSAIVTRLSRIAVSKAEWSHGLECHWDRCWIWHALPKGLVT